MEIQVTDKSVRFTEQSGKIITLPRSEYKLSYIPPDFEEISIIDSKTALVNYKISKITDVASIQDDRTGGAGVVAVPATLELLFDLFENYFFTSTAEINVELENLNVNTDELEDLLKGIGGSTETPAMSRVTNSSTIAAGFFSVSVTNTGAANGTLLATTLKVGETVEFTAKTGNVLGAIAYNATGTEFLIITTKIV